MIKENKNFWIFLGILISLTIFGIILSIFSIIISLIYFIIFLILLGFYILIFFIFLIFSHYINKNLNNKKE